jgi:hypothetical protein
VSTAEFGHIFTWRGGANSYFLYFHEMPGYDDLLTRGNGSLRMPSRHNWGADYQSAVHGRFRYYIGMFAKEQGFTSYTRQLKFQPKYFVTDNLSVGLNLVYTDSPNWLNWVAGREVGIYRRREVESNFSANWYPAPRQELRLRMQWAGLGATARAGYELSPDGTPELLAAVPADFTVSSVGLQLRYRYEFHPLSDLYVVYSRGGDGSLDDREESLRDQFDRAWQQVDTSLLFVKLRYRI